MASVTQVSLTPGSCHISLFLPVMALWGEVENLTYPVQGWGGGMSQEFCRGLRGRSGSKVMIFSLCQVLPCALEFVGAALALVLPAVTLWKALEESQRSDEAHKLSYLALGLI